MEGVGGGGGGGGGGGCCCCCWCCIRIGSGVERVGVEGEVGGEVREVFGLEGGEREGVEDVEAGGWLLWRHSYFVGWGGSVVLGEGWIGFMCVGVAGTWIWSTI